MVVDTNSLVAALTRPQGSSARILDLWREGRIELLATPETLREAELVLGGRWLARMTQRGAVDSLLGELREKTLVVEAPTIPGLKLKDRGDRDLVAAAVHGGAQYLVTADRELLEMRGHQGVEFLTSAEFVRQIGEAAGSIQTEN